MKQRIRVIAFLISALTFQMIGCRSPETRVVEKFKTGNPLVVYELPDRSDTFNYTQKIYYPEGQIHRILQVVNGKYSGVIKTFYNSGKVYELDSLTAPCDKKSGECDGIHFVFYKSGILAERFIMKAGRFAGMSEHYNEKGQLVKTYSLIDDTIKDGIYKEFYENGNISRLATFKMDTLVGYEYYFKENGDTIKYFAHDQGVMDFPYKLWLPDGNVILGVHSSREKILWTWYDKEGRIIKKEIAMPTKSGYIIPH